MKTIKRIKKRKSLIRFIAMFVAAVIVFELIPYFSSDSELTAEAAMTLAEFEQTRWNNILRATFNGYNGMIRKVMYLHGQAVHQQ